MTTCRNLIAELICHNELVAVVIEDIVKLVTVAEDAFYLSCIDTFASGVFVSTWAMETGKADVSLLKAASYALLK